MNVNSRKISIFTLLALIGIGVFSFQNCAPPKNSSAFQSSTAGLDGQVSPSSFSESQTFSVGRCGSVVNTCDEGVFVNEPDTDVSVWRCVGTAGGSSIRCTTNFSSGAIAGVCSSTVNQCIQGQAIDIANTVAGQEAWQCRGFNGGATASCTQTISGTAPKVDGVCGSQILQCLAGTVIQNVTPPAGSTDIFWVCNGVNGGAPSPVCRFQNRDPMAPLCGGTDATCLNGSTVVEVEDQGPSFLWKCTKPGYTPVSCSVAKPTCILGVEQRTHYLDSFTYTLSVPTGSLPSVVNVRYSGTKNGVIDATGNDNYLISNVSTNPFRISMQNPGGAAAATYTRSFAISTTRGKELCRTNIVDQVLTPKCGLSFDKATMLATETHVATFNFAADTQIVSPNPSGIKWYGTKDGAEDERGQTSFGISVAENKTAVKTMGPFAVGNYQRYFIAQDSAGTELCKSVTASFTVTAPQPINGACESSTHPLEAETCAAGTPGGIGPSNDTTTEYVWSCQGVNTGTSTECRKAKPEPTVTNPNPNPSPTAPVCSTVMNQCLSGTVGNIARDCAAGERTWTCSNGTTTINCWIVTEPFCRVVEDPCGRTLNSGSATIQLQLINEPCR